MLVKYKETFSLRDERCTCPNIEADLQVIDKSPFSITAFHVKEEDTPIIIEEKQRLVHLDILKQDMSPYVSPIMHSVRKILNLKRIITGFRFFKK